MRHSTSAFAQAQLFRSSLPALIGLSLFVAVTAGCDLKPPRPLQPLQAWLYVGSSVPAIETFNVALTANGLPQIRRTASGTNVASGAVFAMVVVNQSLYAATGGGSVAQFTIDPLTGSLTLRGTIPCGSPPYAMTATAKNVYVANRGSNNVSVYSIDAASNLTSLQTAAVNGVNSLQLDPSGKFLFIGSRVGGPTGPQVCTYTLQPDGSLPATPNCVSVNGAPQAMQFSGGVLFLLFYAMAPPALGATNWVSAWTVNPTTGVLTHRGSDLDIGAANTGGMTVSTNGKTLFVPRQGGFTTVGTDIPLTSAMITFTPTRSQSCLLPPAGAGEALIDPRGKALYITDPVGVVTGNIGGNVSTMYEYTGNHFTFAIGRYTMSDFVTVTLTLPQALQADSPLQEFYPTSFTLSDGKQTITNNTPDLFDGGFYFSTSGGQIDTWQVEEFIRDLNGPVIGTFDSTGDFGQLEDKYRDRGSTGAPGVWSVTTTGPRVSLLEITPGGALNLIQCETAGTKPLSMAIFIPLPKLRQTRFFDRVWPGWLKNPRLIRIGDVEKPL